MAFTIKICGLSEPSTLAAALDAGADMVGFVCFEASPRHVAPTAARALATRVEGRAQIVALTVDADDRTLEAIVRGFAPDLIQMHGHETVERIEQVKTRFGLPAIKAVGLRDRADLDRVALADQIADYLLLDAAATAARPGGNGQAFDWSLLDGLMLRRPWLLAGGLRPETVRSAVLATRADGVDVSSGVEMAPGIKDAARIAAFVAAARAAAAERCT